MGGLERLGPWPIVPGVALAALGAILALVPRIPLALRPARVLALSIVPSAVLRQLGRR